MTTLPEATALGRVHLRVPDLEHALEFYSDALRLVTAERADGSLSLAATDGGPELIRLREDPGARPRPSGTTGLYHYALRVPDRRALGRIFLRLRGTGASFHGYADHAVSEALYLSDPDGNGIEIYTDRPRSAWQRRGGELFMTTQPLDLDALVADARGEPEPWTGLPPETEMGHIHLQVSDLARAEAFYHGDLGFDVMVRSYPGALFLSAGGYHHHIGLNTWAGEGAGPPSVGALGLIDFEIRLPEEEALARVVQRTAAERVGRGRWRVSDPDGWAVLLASPNAD